MGQDGSELCRKKDSLPDLIFNIDGHAFGLEPSDYNWDFDGVCYSGLMPDDSQEDMPPRIILGNAFLTRWMSVFDFGKRTISLGRAKPKQ